MAINPINERKTRSRKVRAILAGGIVLGVGAISTLAAWTDNEWVLGASDSNGTPGTAVVKMEQNVAGTGTAVWNEQATQATGGALKFTVNSGALTPSKTVYASLQLRAAASSAALNATLSQAVQDGTVNTTTNSTDLYNALKVQIKTRVSPTECNATSFSTTGTDLLASGSALSATSNTNISLTAGTTKDVAGTPVSLCFALTLPDNADTSLQGKNTQPAWLFTGVVA